MAIEGSLREFAVQDILQLLHLSRKTGELVIIREPSHERGSVVFDGGAVVRAEVDGTTASLGHLLLNAGKITESELERAEELREQNPQKNWAEVFGSLDVVSSEEVNKHLRFQVEEQVLDILDWSDGTFSFGERRISEAERLTWIPTESLIMEGARRADELSTLPGAIASDESVPQFSEQAAEGGQLDLLPEEWEVLGHVDGAQTVKQIAWALGRSEFEVSKVIAKLVTQGLLDLATNDARTRPPQEISLDEAERFLLAGEMDRAIGRIENVLRKHPEEPRALYLQARVAERLGSLTDAAHGYETTLELDPLAASARLRLGMVKLRLGDLTSAISEWKSYVKMSHDSKERNQVEDALRAANELEAALRELDGGNS